MTAKGQFKALLHSLVHGSSQFGPPELAAMLGWYLWRVPSGDGYWALRGHYPDLSPEKAWSLRTLTASPLALWGGIVALGQEYGLAQRVWGRDRHGGRLSGFEESIFELGFQYIMNESPLYGYVVSARDTEAAGVLLTNLKLRTSLGWEPTDSYLSAFGHSSLYVRTFTPVSSVPVHIRELAFQRQALKMLQIYDHRLTQNGNPQQESETILESEGERTVRAILLRRHHRTHSGSTHQG